MADPTFQPVTISGLATQSLPRLAQPGAAVGAPVAMAAPPVVATPPAPALTPAQQNQVGLTQLNAKEAAARQMVNSLPTYNAVQPATAPAAPAAPNPRNFAPAPVGASTSRFVDPSNAIATGFNQQEAYAQNMANLIQHLASIGDSRNYSFRLAHLANALNGSNFGAVQGQGADALNQSIAGITSAGIYGGATLGAAQTAANASMYNTDNAAQPFGSVTEYNPRIPGAPLYQQTVYGSRSGNFTPFQFPGMTSSPYTSKPNIPDGATVVNKGVTYVRKSGQWIPQGQ